MKIAAIGTFDMLHPGHLDYLNQAKELGELIVIVARDKNVIKEKGKPPVVNERDRLELVKSMRIVDDAVLGYEDDKLKIIEDIKPDIIFVGYDFDEVKLREDIKKRGLDIEIKKAKPYKENKYKSSILKKEGILD